VREAPHTVDLGRQFPQLERRLRVGRPPALPAFRRGNDDRTKSKLVDLATRT